MIVTLEHIRSYVDSKRGAWAATTLRSESSRLSALLEELNMEPRMAYTKLAAKGLKPYSIKTAFVRMSSFYAWMQEEQGFQGKNLFAKFLREQAQLFKHVYKKERLQSDFLDAKNRISKIGSASVRQLAEEMLSSGVRVSECLNREVQSDCVVGKRGSSRRVNINPSNNKAMATYSEVHRGLREVGLKPHTLRKLFATRLVERGFKLPELMEVMGWRSVQTAASYLQPISERELLAKVAGAVE